MNHINYLINIAHECTTQTEFMKAISHNDRFGCITVEDGSKWYPELQGGKTISHFLRDLYKSIKQLEEEGNEAVEEIVVSESNETEEVVNETIETTINEVAATIDAKEIKLIQRALDASGYDSEPTKENLIECFRDYVASGCWSNLDLDEADQMLADNELTVRQMCIALIKL